MKTRQVDVKIETPEGDIIFQKDGFEIPVSWSDRAATIVASKYAMDNENSAIDVINRVATQITTWGCEQNYLRDSNSNEVIHNAMLKEKDIEISNTHDFFHQLKDILLNQRAAFNSPVWFNCGADTGIDQMSACFILPIEDTMESILNHNTTEGLIFRGGSGAGSNVSKIRAKGEKLSNKGIASGPLVFMEMWDSTAGAIRSGGKTRRSAKMICMNTDHPDIIEFINCKKLEEDKAKILIGNGVTPEEAYSTVAFQNTNHSIRADDKFMEAVVNGDTYSLKDRNTDKTKSSKGMANDILKLTAKIAWETGDPGIQFDTKMNEDNPIPSVDRINSTNPCSEFSAVDNSSCNLASLNLLKYFNRNLKDNFNWKKFKDDINILITAMDILIEPADYPTPEIRDITIKTRPLGLGFSNLGALLMTIGHAYDSEKGREIAAKITKVMTTQAYCQSMKLAYKLGSFSYFNENIEANREIILRLTEDNVLADAIRETGLRNSQVTLLAPTGTISFLMDCDTTGIEPLFALKTLKQLAGGGTIELDYPCVEKAVDRLRKIRGNNETYEQILDLKHDLFKTSNEISWKSHIDMMAACQKHLNGAISKTVNMSADTKVEEVYNSYLYAWKAGIKCLAIYRDGCKMMQPLTDTNKKEEPEIEIADTLIPGIAPATRLKPSVEGMAHRLKIEVSGHKGYVHAGMYPDGSLCEIFIRMSKEGSMVSGMMDAFATSVSLGLQHGVPLSKLVEKFKNTQFQPSGWTSNKDIGYASSIVDYIFKWLEIKFLKKEENEEYEEEYKKSELNIPNKSNDIKEIKPVLAFDGPECPECENITSKVGACYLCNTCGATTGCS